MLRAYTLLVLLLFATYAEARDRVKAQYIEETELVSIVAHLAEANGYDWDTEDVGVDDYLAEVDSAFAPFRSHPIVPYIRKELHGEGFNWHFPMHIALRLHIVDGNIMYDEDLEKDFDDYYDRITPENEKKFIQLLQDFYDASRFHEFYTQHTPLYEAFWPQLKDKMEAFFTPNAQHYAEEAYGEPILVLNETFVEACVMRYLMSHPFDFSENTDRWIEMLSIDDGTY